MIKRIAPGALIWETLLFIISLQLGIAIASHLQSIDPTWGLCTQNSDCSYILRTYGRSPIGVSWSWLGIGYDLSVMIMFLLYSYMSRSFRIALALYCTVGCMISVGLQIYSIVSLKALCILCFTHCVCAFIVCALGVALVFFSQFKNHMDLLGLYIGTSLVCGILCFRLYHSMQIPSTSSIVNLPLTAVVGPQTPTLGIPSSKKATVIFADPECFTCSTELPILLARLTDTPSDFYIFKLVPKSDESRARCLLALDAMKHLGVRKSLLRLFSGEIIDPSQPVKISETVDLPPTFDIRGNSELRASKQLFKAWSIKGTPTVISCGKRGERRLLSAMETHILLVSETSR